MMSLRMLHRRIGHRSAAGAPGGEFVTIETIISPLRDDSRPMPRRPELSLERFVPYRLSVLSNTVSSAIASAYQRRFRLSIPEWRVMVVLAATPGLSAAEVAQRTAMDKVAVSRAVASLLARRRIERRAAAGDRRRAELRLAAAGARVHAQVVPFALAYERQLLGALDRSDRAALERLLVKLMTRATELRPLRD